MHVFSCPYELTGQELCPPGMLDILCQHLESESGGQFRVAENPTETFTCVCNGGEFVPRTGKVKVRSSFDVSEARAVSCALVSEASTSFETWL